MAPKKAPAKKKTTNSNTPVVPNITTYKGQTINWDTPGTRRPTEAFVRPGQTPTTPLAKSTVKNRFEFTGPKLSTGPFANSGNPNSKQFNVTKGNVANAALTVVAAPASVGRGAIGPVTSAVVKKVQKYVGGKALPVLSQGLNKSGAGGRLYGALTPEGVALASTRIGTAAQQGARMGNLSKNALNKSAQIALGVGDDVIRGMNIGGKIVKGGAVTGIVAPKVVPKNKKKK